MFTLQYKKNTFIGTEETCGLDRYCLGDAPRAQQLRGRDAPTRGKRRSICALTVQSDCLRVVQQHPTRGQCTALPGRSCNRAVTIARPLSRLTEPPSSPAVASAPASAMPSSRSSRVRTWRRPSAAEYVPSAMSCPISCTAAPTASRDDTLPSRARLLFVWFKAPLANPFLRVGICAVRRPHKARRPSPLEHFRALPAHGPRNAG